jgi:hypothetical protein
MGSKERKWKDWVFEKITEKFAWFRGAFLPWMPIEAETENLQLRNTSIQENCQ